MVKKLDSFLVSKTIEEKGIKVFTPQELAVMFSVSNLATTMFLHRNTKKGVFEKVKNGLYVLARNPPNPMYLANKMIEPSYISFESALSIYSIIPEVAYAITSATTKSSREVVFRDTAFDYIKLKKELFFGYSLKEEANEQGYQMASPEKALCDYLYLVSLGQRNLNDRLSTRSIDKEKAMQIAKKFGRAGLKKLVREVLYA